MAGGGDFTHESRSKKGKKRKKARRIGIRIDMTPLVDIAFLLLTFFMLTTTMSRPQTMEINLPPDEKVTVEIAESNLLTLRITEKGEIFWNFAIDAPKRIEYKELRDFLRRSIQSNPKMVTLVKVDRLGKFSMMVSIIDELNVSEITRFSLAPLTEEDKKQLARAQA